MVVQEMQDISVPKRSSKREVLRQQLRMIKKKGPIYLRAGEKKKCAFVFVRSRNLDYTRNPPNALRCRKDDAWGSINHKG